MCNILFQKHLYCISLIKIQANITVNIEIKIEVSCAGWILGDAFIMSGVLDASVGDLQPSSLGQDADVRVRIQDQVIVFEPGDFR